MQWRESREKAGQGKKTVEVGWEVGGFVLPKANDPGGRPKIFQGTSSGRHRPEISPAKGAEAGDREPRLGMRSRDWGQ